MYNQPHFVSNFSHRIHGINSSLLVVFLCISTIVYSQDDFCQNFHPHFSPDGHSILFDGLRDGRHEVFLFHLDNRELTMCTDHQGRDAHPFWSPDGRFIAFQSPRKHKESFLVDIFIMKIDGSRVRQLVSKPGFSGVPAWSPDGEWILYQYKPLQSKSDFQTNKWDIFKIKIDGSEEIRLTDTNYEDQVPNWHPKGQTIVFHSDRDGHNNLYLMSSHGEIQRQLTQDTFNQSSATFSPDGEYIAFKSNQTGTKEIFIMKITSGETSQITDGYNVYGLASWSPDGQSLIFHSNKSGTNQIYIINLSTKELTQLPLCH